MKATRTVVILWMILTTSVAVGTTAASSSHHSIRRIRATVSEEQHSKGAANQLAPGYRECSSPEIDKPWILDAGNCNTTTTTKTDAVIFGSSRTIRDRTCGLCHQNEFASYLTNLVKEIEELRKSECSRLVVYSVAFGQKYVRMLRNNNKSRRSRTEVKKTLDEHGRCFITFILAKDQDHTKAISNEKRPHGPHYSATSDGLTMLVPIDEKYLPYISMRRNTKLFKMSGGLLFPFAQRIIWQDVKLGHSVLPDSYFRYFDDTVERYHVCVSFMGLPLHRLTMGDYTRLTSVSFAEHCKAIAKAARKRPTVSDDLQSVDYQCSAYLDAAANQTASNRLDKASDKTSVLDRSLIDSAFMVWDMRDQRCRDFAADLGCTWLDEIHCHSDRDQLSFPHALASMNLEEIGHGVAPETGSRVFAGFDENDVSSPMVHIARSSCHWYFHGLDKCDPEADRSFPDLNDWHIISPRKLQVFSDFPSDAPSDVPSAIPRYVPSDFPSDVPSDAPSDVPSAIPRYAPRDFPSDVPSDVPAIPSDFPSDFPNDVPSDVPVPSDMPKTQVPSSTQTPTRAPADAFTLLPTQTPQGPTVNQPGSPGQSTTDKGGGGLSTGLTVFVVVVGVLLVLLVGAAVGLYVRNACKNRNGEEHNRRPGDIELEHVEMGAVPPAEPFFVPAGERLGRASAPSPDDDPGPMFKDQTDSVAGHRRQQAGPVGVASALSPDDDPGPMFKDQTRNVPGNRRQQAGPVGVASTFSPDDDPGPTFKDQTRTVRKDRRREATEVPIVSAEAIPLKLPARKDPPGKPVEDEGS